MRTRLMIGCLSALVLGIAAIGCNREEIKPSNQLDTQQQEIFNSEGYTMGTVDCPYDRKALKAILSSSEQKAAWPKVKVTATFGGFPACEGCENCGCCIGLCIQIGRRSSLAYSPLTNDEILNKEVLFDFIDRPAQDEIVLIPNNNVDNGDGYLHIEDDATFSKEVNDYIGREVKMAKGSYEIVPTAGYNHGVIVVTTL